MPKKKETSSDRYKRTIRQRRVFVLSIFVIVVMLCICLFTPLFGISDISVIGNAVVSSEDIIEASGIKQGENVFRINTTKAEKNLSAIAYVERAEIKRKFPARIEIEVQEAKPDIIIDTPTQFIVTTVNGRVLELTDDVTHLTSPIVYGVEVTGAEIAKNVQTADEELFAMNMEYIRCFYNTEHWQNIDEFYVSDNTNFMVVMKSGMKVTFGSIDSTEGLLRKIKMMTKIFEQVEQSERSYLDLTTDKGYYGEYSWAEMEEMKRKALGIEEEEEPEEEETDSEEEDTSDEEEDSSEKTEKSEKSEKPKKSEKSEKPADDEKEKESAKKSEKPKASAKPSASADPRKKESADAKETESAGNESEKSDESSEKTEESTASDDEE